ncbi:MAG: deoxynucleoside kinase [Gammaproteobacteria bacterium]|nr:deoxynucleoside kinase [Gammaproteobacteria bacterium]
MNTKKRFIVVEGPIGVGKTTLATKLSNTFNSGLLLEDFSNNPFLEKFYEKPKQYAFITQLYFLLQRSEQFSEKKQNEINEKFFISDFYIAKDKLFAENTLNSDEFKLYMRLYELFRLNSPKPDLVIYLQSTVSSLVDRIKSRGIPYEQNITTSYLSKINDAYTKLFHNYSDSPLLIINTSDVDVNNSKDYDLLIEEISKNIKGKQYFNPTK